jgi:hypothetical protein
MRDYRTDLDYQRQERLAAKQAVCDHSWSYNGNNSRTKRPPRSIRWCPKCMAVQQLIKDKNDCI